MSKSKLKNSASEDETNGTEESETPDVEHLSDFTKLQLHLYKPYPGKESSDSEEGTSKICVLVVNTNQWLKAFATWINKKCVKVV